MKKKILILALFILTTALLAVNLYQDVLPKGIKIDSYQGVAVYFNGFDYQSTYGKNYAADRYYYGQKWQCVEFVKRFYHDVKRHNMPDVYGHAKDFFEIGLDQGQLNKRRGLIQYKNGGKEKPRKDDILVFISGSYGHVAIITEVSDSFVEVIQQNVFRKTRETLELSNINGRYYLSGRRVPAGWLRLP